MSKHGNDDEDAFREAMAGVNKLDHDLADPFRRRRRPVPLPRQQAEEEEEALRDLAIETPEFLDFRRAGVQKRVYGDLQRGVISPEATIDLHGMRVAEARGAFLRFLVQSLHAGRRCIRIVHGKGRRSDGTQPVLKQKTNQWLRQRDEVLAFCSAPRWDGGTGAAYVLLKRVWASR
jgi:DNA-nicking Smr family endonuclease